MSEKLFTVRECGKGAVVSGLEKVDGSNALLLRLATDKPIQELKVGEFTFGRRHKDVFEIIRVDTKGDER